MLTRLSKTVLALCLAAPLCLMATGCYCGTSRCCPAPSRPATARTQAKESPKYLFVQSAERAALENGRVALHGVSHTTLFFSDRPYRLTGHVTTQAFIDGWTTGPNSFADTPPNATLSVLGGKEIAQVVAVLSDPAYDTATRTLSYAVKILEGEVPTDGTGVSLFIDDSVAIDRHPIEHGTIENRYPGGTQRKIVHGNIHHADD